jgi:transcription initiation factor TFIIIB Brf1 subunit/transcription initiation factor TFIIB
MLTSTFSDRCIECSAKVIDLNDELVCTSCGSVMTKEIVESCEERKPQAMDYTKHALGSYLGPLEYGYEERFSRGFSKTSSTFRYLKTVSDYSCRDESAVYACAKLIERICEKLSIPRTVLGQSISIAKSMIEMKKVRGEFTTAAISTFSIITACKICGITNVGVKEVIEAHRDLGHRVKTSTIIRMSIDSPIKLRPRRAEEYLNRAIAHLSSDERLASSIRERGLDWTVYCHHLFEIAKEILAMIDEPARGGHSPYALAATSVYAAEAVSAKVESRSKFLTQFDVAQPAGVAEYTVREQYGEIFRPRLERICDAIMQTLNRRDATQIHPTHPLPNPPTT